VAWTVKIKRSASKELKSVPRRDQRRIAIAIELLSENPFPANAKRLTGTNGCYRVRVGDWRVVYEIKNEKLIIFIVRIGHRKDVYRKL